LTLGAIVLVLLAVVAAAGLIKGPQSTAAQTQTASASAPPVAVRSTGVSSESPAASPPAPSPSISSQPTSDPTSTPAPTPTPTQRPNAGAVVDMPFVPVVGFWSAQTTVSPDEIRAAAAGNTAKFGKLIVPADDAAAIAQALGTHAALDTGSVRDIEAALKTGRLGILRATDVTARVHALSIGDASLFGNDRVNALTDWPLVAPVQSETEWDLAASWTLVAAGDIMGDRGVAKQWRPSLGGKGGDYLFDGGSSRTNGTKCCSPFGYPIWKTQRTGNAGALRELVSGADVAAANLETAVLVNAPFHSAGLKFTTDASLMDSIDKAGFDFLSLGNNHIRNGGDKGVLTAVSELDARGIEHSGAGRAGEADDPGIFDVNGLRVAIIGCDAIRPGWAAGPTRAVGTNNCKNSGIAKQIGDLRPSVDVIIVFPHWGKEYTPKPVVYQRQLAAQWVVAGADLVIGAHSHVAGGIEEIDDHLAFYSMGNLIFDQNWSQATMVGVIPELTFHGTQLVQVRLHPTLIIDSQPNLLAPADGGQYVLDQMKTGSTGLLDF
jgi:poly-gamma-glutamate capsule biosynthesis protein CapA/YwtB (metallophosphatase superfamily)